MSFSNVFELFVAFVLGGGCLQIRPIAQFHRLLPPAFSKLPRIFHAQNIDHDRGGLLT